MDMDRLMHIDTYWKRIWMSHATEVRIYMPIAACSLLAIYKPVYCTKSVEDIRNVNFSMKRLAILLISPPSNGMSVYACV